MHVVIDWQGRSEITAAGLSHLVAMLNELAYSKDMLVTVLFNEGVSNLVDIRLALRQRSICADVKVWFGKIDGSSSSRNGAVKSLHRYLLESMGPSVVFAVFDGTLKSENIHRAYVACGRAYPVVADFRNCDVDGLESLNSSGVTEQSLDWVDLCLVCNKRQADALKKQGVPINKVTEFKSDTKLSALINLTELYLESVKAPDVRQANESASLLRLAFVTPLPPVESGIADYSVGVLAALCRFYEVDVIVDQNYVRTELLHENVSVRDVAWFKRNSHVFDRVCYQFGNSPHHAYMVDLIAGKAGVVVMHDFFLADLGYYVECHISDWPTFSHALYVSHGYGALSDRSVLSMPELVTKYPCNLEIIQRSVGTIFHSHYAERLMGEWYAEWPDGVRTIALPRTSICKPDKSRARELLGISPTDFVVCCFGVLGDSKQNDLIVNAWMSSSLAGDTDCYLTFVGQDFSGKYMRMLAGLKGKGRERIRITGWVSRDDYEAYLAAADCAVQLRVNSRGEASASLLDCLNYGLPTITNRHGFAASLPAHTVYFLEEYVTVPVLARSIEQLKHDSAKRAELAIQSRLYVHAHHRIDTCISEYVSAIEQFYALAANGVNGLISGLPSVLGDQWDTTLVKEVSADAARSFKKNIGARQLLIDITAIARTDLKTGIQRAVRSLLLELIKAPPIGFRVEPVYLSDQGGYWHLRYARSYTLELLGSPGSWTKDEPLDVLADDVFLGLDLSGGYVVEAARHSDVFHSIRRQGALVAFVIYDLLPILMPKYFPHGAEQGHIAWLDCLTAISDLLICISKSVAQDVSQQLALRPSKGRPLPDVTHFHLGADVAASNPSMGMPADAELVFSAISQGASFLMVGTVEPRKGHRLVLSAFERMWQDGYAVSLVIVGKQGWMMEDFVASIQSNSRYNKSLFWLPSVSDEYLEALYSASDCLIAASEGEGFGLPLIEAADKGIPVIARDIPVFREVAGDYAYFFTSVEPNDLAMELEGWLTSFRNGMHPSSAGMPRLTWKESADQLKALISEAIKSVPRPHTISIGSESHDQ